jgi:hypothetical protein
MANIQDLDEEERLHLRESCKIFVDEKLQDQ